jgi:hypothetical protein
MTPIIHKIEQKIISEEVNGYYDQEPYALFIKNEELNIYIVRIIAFIPKKVKEDFVVAPPSDQKDVKTPFGDLPMRTIYLSWKKNVRPEEGPHTLWSITVQYTSSGAKKEKGIKVRYKFNQEVSIYPRTSRGTVTTSSDPCE